MILLVALLIEIAFAAYCVFTRSNQTKARSVVRLVAFGVFVLLMLVSVIEWGFRWYALAALLLIWALLGAQTLLRGQQKKEYRTGRILFEAVAMLLLVVVALIPALVFPQHKAPRVTGTHEIATVTNTYTDPSRTETFTNTGAKREVNVECWYPLDEEGKYPLIVFSHGAFGIKASNTSTFTDLASNGYVVCSIDHPYHALYTMDSERHLVRSDRSFMQEVIDANNGKYDEATIFALQQKWMQLRVADIEFVLDTLLAQAQDPAADAFYRHIDPEKIGLMGHSLGGASSALVARERNDIGAVVNLDADLMGEYVDFADGTYVLNDTLFPVPILTILADDMVRLIDAVPNANETVAVQHVSASAPHAYEVHIMGTDHQSLTDLPLVSPALASLITMSVKKAGGGATADKYAVIEKMNDLVLGFFNFHLKGAGSFAPAATY